jgi:hypothetical protein
MMMLVGGRTVSCGESISVNAPHPGQTGVKETLVFSGQRIVSPQSSCQPEGSLTRNGNVDSSDDAMRAAQGVALGCTGQAETSAVSTGCTVTRSRDGTRDEMGVMG